MKNTIIALCLLTSIIAKAQQEPHYTQNQFNSMLMLNPAYAGSDANNTSMGIRYRNQWTGFDGAPKTIGIIADTRIKRLGLGLTFNVDKIGIEQHLTPDINLSYHIPVGEKSNLSIGMKGGIEMIKADFTKLAHVSLGDPLYNSSNEKVNIPYLGLGALYYNPRFYIGISSPRLFSFDKPSAPRSKVGTSHFYAYGGGRIFTKTDIELRPAFLVKYHSQAPVELDIALDTWYKSFIGFGVGYRTGDAINFMVKSNISKAIYIGYSYDMNISKLKGFNGGTHEVFIGIKLPKKAPSSDEERNNNMRYF